jgi:anti-sigma factor RsiW
MEHLTCLTDNTMAAYADGNLDEQERATAEMHLAHCLSCRRILALIIKSQSDVPDPLSIVPRSRSSQ